LEKYLIIRFSSIGDIVLTTPVIAALKKAKPNCEIHFLTKANFSFLVEHHPQITKVHRYQNKIGEVKQDLKAAHFTAIIDLHHNLRSLKVKRWLSNVPSYSFNKLNLEKWLYVNFKYPKLPNKHIVERYLETLKSLQVPYSLQTSLAYFPNPDAEIESLNLPQNFIAVVMGASYQAKKLRVNKLAKVISNSPNHYFILLGGKTDMDDAQNLISALGSTENIKNLVGKISFGQSALVVKNAKLIISNDTGLMHVAAAFQKDIISIWAGTVPEFGMYPFNAGSNSIMVQPKGLKKRPCSKLGNRCRYKKCLCAESVPEQEITQHIVKVLG
jgi:ADP-heptose:LPS heptosyltransferase